MPVFVEWRWKEKTKTFLVIFHFYDDFSKSNLRIKLYTNEKRLIASLEPLEVIRSQEAWMTWSPSHTEMALLAELLSFANIVNGLTEFQKRRLKNPLEGRGGHALDILQELPDGKKEVFYTEKSGTCYRCPEICQEYIDYLRKLLEPYIK